MTLKGLRGQLLYWLAVGCSVFIFYHVAGRYPITCNGDGTAFGYSMNWGRMGALDQFVFQHEITMEIVAFQPRFEIITGDLKCL